jgi:hypothetical protein
MSRSPCWGQVTGTKTETTTTTLVQLVGEYCQLERKAESMLFPLTEQALEMFEHGLDAKRVGKEFRLAFAQANEIAAKQLSKHAGYRNFSKRMLEMVKVAKCGRPWYEEQRAKKTAFYDMYELARAQSKPKPTESDVERLVNQGQKFLESKFFAQLSVLIDSKEGHSLS